MRKSRQKSAITKRYDVSIESEQNHQKSAYGIPAAEVSRSLSLLDNTGILNLDQMSSLSNISTVQTSTTWPALGRTNALKTGTSYSSDSISNSQWPVELRPSWVCLMILVCSEVVQWGLKVSFRGTGVRFSRPFVKDDVKCDLRWLGCVLSQNKTELHIFTDETQYIISTYSSTMHPRWSSGYDFRLSLTPTSRGRPV